MTQYALRAVPVMKYEKQHRSAQKCVIRCCTLVKYSDLALH